MKLFPNLAEKVKTGFYSLSQDKLSRFFFYLLILFLPTQLGKHFWPDFSFVYGIRLDYLSPTFYFSDLILIFLIFFSFKETINKLIKKSYFKAFLIFTLILLLSSLFSKNIYASFFGLIKFLEFSYLLSYTALNIKKINKKMFFILLFLGSTFESLLSFFQIINNGSLGGFLYYLGERTFNSQTPGIANTPINGILYLRPYATFSHPNVLAFYLIASQLLILNYFEKLKQYKFVVLFSLILTTIAIFLTLGRVSILIWIFDLFLIFYIQILEKYKNKKKKIIFMITVSIFLLSLVFFQNNIYLKRFTQLNLNDQSYTQRTWLISESARILKNNLLFGVGLNNFYYNLNPFFQNSKVLFIQPVHNIYIFTLVETGVLGFLFFLYLMLKALRSARKKKYIFILLLNVIFLGFFDHYFLTLQQGQLLFALILGLSLAQ